MSEAGESGKKGGGKRKSQRLSFMKDRERKDKTDLIPRKTSLIKFVAGEK